MSAQFVVRPGAADDIEACVALSSTFDPAGADAWRRTLERTVLDGVGRALFVAETADAQIVGYGRVVRSEPPATPDGWYLLGLIVDAAWRRRGIGEALTKARMHWVRQRAERIFYFTHQDNRASQKLHEALGFRSLPGEFLPPGGTAEFAKTQLLFVAALTGPLEL